MKIIIILIITFIAFAAGGTEKYNIKELSRSEDTQLRKAAVSRMYLLKDAKFIPDIIKALEDKEPVVRKIAIYASERINDKTFIPPVIKLLEDPDNGVKAAAIIALGKFEDVSAAPALINALKKETSPDIKTALIRSLGSIGSKEAIPYIIEALGDKKLSEKEDVWDYTEALNVVLKEYFNDKLN